MELAREPMVWWSLASAFVFMFVLVLAANLFAVRDAFDPRQAGRRENGTIPGFSVRNLIVGFVRPPMPADGCVSWWHSFDRRGGQRDLALLGRRKQAAANRRRPCRRCCGCCRWWAASSAACCAL